MGYEAATQWIHIWVTSYLAIFCLATLAAWIGGSYLWSRHWQKPVRDCISFLGAIGVLGGFMLFEPHTADPTVWSPLFWFSFTMLLVLELLWISFIAEAAARGLVRALTPAFMHDADAAHTARPALARPGRHPRG